MYKLNRVIIERNSDSHIIQSKTLVKSKWS